MRKMQMKTVKVENNNINKALLELAELDDDFNGKNGEEYLWKPAKEQGYESNAKYLLTAAKKDCENDVEFIENFIHIWMTDDYYIKYILDCKSDDNGNVGFIALSFMIEL